jgi:hypothetical protein
MPEKTVAFITAIRVPTGHISLSWGRVVAKPLIERVTEHNRLVSLLK